MFPRDEVQATVDRYVDVRERIDKHELGWDALTQFFTDDVVYIDPAWGRVEGMAAFEEFLRDSMAGLDDWTFAIELALIEGDDVVVKWRQRFPGSLPDGRAPNQTGYSHLVYAGNGKFRYDEDLLNMTHVMEELATSGWQPTGPMNMPPEHPNRDTTIPG